MAYDGAVIRIPLESDVQGFVSDIKKQIKGVKNLGLDVDTSSLENALDSYLEAFKKISNQKLNTSSFTKAQENVGKEIDALKQRTSALESGFASLIDVMKSAEGGKFANSLQDIKQNMQSLYDVTTQTVGAMQQMSAGKGDTSSLEKTLSILKDIQNIKADNEDNEEIFGDFKTAKKKLFDLYNEIIKKRTELSNIDISSDDDHLKVAAMQKEVSDLAVKWKSIYSANYEKFGQNFDALTFKVGGTDSSFKELARTVSSTFDSIQKNINGKIPYIENSLNALSSINTLSSISDYPQQGSSLGDIHVKVATTTKGLKTQLTNLLESVQPYLDDNPLEIGVTLATEWGTRRNKELLKQFQQQIDNLSEDTDVSSLRNLYEDIQKSFGNEINLRFKSNFDEEQKAIRAGVAALKSEIKNQFTLNPKISKTAADKMQSQLDGIAQTLVLSISQVKLTDGAIKNAAQLEADQISNSSIGAEALSGVIDAIVEKSGELNKQLIPTWQTLVDIREVLKQYPIDSIVDSTRELVRVIQQAFGVLSQEDLDSMFSGLQKRANAIAGNLGLGENQLELKSILARYREYLSLGGKNALSDLGGNEKVQGWFKRNKDIILETKDAVEQLDKAEDKLTVDNGELSSIDSLSSKLDDVIDKVQKKTDEFKNEETIVSQITTNEIHELDGIIKKLLEIKNIFSSLVDGKKIGRVTSNLLNALDNILDRINEIYSTSNSAGNILSKMHNANKILDGGAERIFFGNSTNGKLGNTYTYGEEEKVSAELVRQMRKNYQDTIKSYPDTFFHTHPAKVGTMSLDDGDLQVFYNLWKESNGKLKKAVISGIEESEIFNFGDFFEKYGKDYSSKLKNEIEAKRKELNDKVDANIQKTVLDDLYDQGLSIADDNMLFDVAFSNQTSNTLKNNLSEYFRSIGTTFDDFVINEIRTKNVTIEDAATEALNKFAKDKSMPVDELSDALKNLENASVYFRQYLNLIGQSALGIKEIVLENQQKLLREYTPGLMEDVGIKDFNNFVSHVKTSDVDSALGMPRGSIFNIKEAQDYLGILNEILQKLKEISIVSDGVKITAETNIDSDSIEKIISAIRELQQAISDIQTSLSNGTVFKGLANLSPEDAENISKVTSALVELSKVLPSEDFGKSLDKVRTFVNAFSNEKGSERIRTAAENIKELRNALDGEVSSNSLLIFQKLSESTDISGLVTEIKNLLKIEAAANQAAVAKKDFSEANQKMKDSADESSLSLEEEKKKFDKIWSKLQDLNQEKFMPGFVEQIEKIEIALSGIDDTADDAAQAYKDLSTEASRLWKERGFPEWKKAAEGSIASLQAKIAKFGRDNTAIAKQFSDRLEDIRSQLHDGMSIEEVQKLGAAFKKLDADIATAGQGGLSFFDTLRKRLMGVNAQLIAQYLSWQDMIRYTRQAVEVVKDLDTALVDLKKTTTMSESELNDFYYSANDIAKQMGVTTEEIINQAASWSRLGYSSKEAAETMAALSSQFASISPGMDTATAQEGLVSIMKAYKVEVDNVERDIMDNINVLGNKFAETNEDIVEGMKRAGATLSVMGTSIQDSFALFTGAQEVIQNAETVGTALKTLSLRIRGYDEETEELSDDIIAATGKVADLTKVASNNFAGVSLWADAEQTQYRSLKDYLGDIAEIWDEIDAKSQTELLENLFGKRGASVGSAILTNFNQVEKAIEEMENAAGAADAEMSIIEESLEYKINNLQQTWVGIIQELIDNGMLGKIVDALTNISEVLGEIITTIGPVPTIIGALGLRELLLNLDKIENAPEKIDELVQKFSGLSRVTKSSEVFIGETADAINGVGKAAKISSNSVNVLKNGLLALAKNPITWIVVGLIAAKAVFDKLNVTVEETQEEIDGINSTISEIVAEMEQLNALENRTEGQEARLQLLQDELAIQKDLLEVAERRNLLEKSGKKFTDYFDKDNWNTKITGFESNNPNTLKDSEVFRKYQFDAFAKEYSELQTELSQLRANLENSRRSVNEHNKDRADAEKVKARLDNLERETYENYYESLQDYADLKTTAESIRNSLEGITEEDPLFDVLTDLSQRYDTQIQELEAYIIQVDNLLGRESSVTTNSRFNEYNENYKNTLGYEDLVETTKNLSLEQKKLWMTVTAGAESGKEAVDLWNESLKNTDQAAAAIEDLAKAAKEISFTQSISDLNNLENALNNVGNAMANIDENGKFQLGDLDAIADYFLGLETAEEKVEYETEAVANALKLLGEGTGDINAQADAINTLADNYLHTSGILDGLNEKNKELYITRLNSMGIINAEEIVLATLNAQLDAEAQARAVVALQAQAEAQVKELVANETVNLTNLTAEEISALLEEGAITQETALKLLDMAIQKQMVNGTVLTTSGDIANLTALCSSLGVAGSALERYAEMKRIAMDDSGKYTPEYQAGTMKRANQMLQNAIKSAYNSGGAEYNVPKVQYNGGSPVKNKLGYTPSSTADALSGSAAKAAQDAADAASKAAKDAAEDVKEEFEEVYDYFERMIKVLDQSIALLKAHLEDVVGSFAKNTLLNAQEEQIRQKMAGYSEAIEMYSAKASEALSKIPSDVAANLQSGAVAIGEFVGDENKEVVEAAQEYEKWADKVHECKLQIVELREELRQLELQKFKNVAQDFQELFDVRKTQIDLISKAISLFETARDKKVGRAFYDESIEQADKQLSKLLEKRTALTEQMASAIASGVEIANDEWFEMLEAVEQVNADILDTQKSIEEYKNAIIQLYVDAFDTAAKRYSNLISIRQQAIDALENEISLVEAAGNVANRNNYDEMIRQKTQSIADLQAERQSLLAKMTDAMNNGIKVGTDEWFAMESAINEVDSAIQQAQLSVEEYKKSIIALYKELFDREAKRYTNQLDIRQQTLDALSNEVSLVEADGLVANRKYYDEMIRQQTKSIAELQAERQSLLTKMTDAMNNGIKVGTDEWYEMESAIYEVDSAIKQAQLSVKEYNKSIVAIYTELFNQEAKRYQNQMSVGDMATNAIEKQISLIEASGNLAGKAYLDTQMEITRNQIEKLTEERAALMKRMSDATANGVKVASDEWMEMVEALNSVDTALQDATQSMEALDDAILALHTATFERIQSRFSSLRDELSNMADMYADYDVATDDNKWTDEGLAQLGLAAQQYELAKKNVENYNAEIEELNKQYAAGKYSVTEYTSKLADLKSKQWDSVNASESAKKSIIALNKARVDIAVKAIEKETDAYKKLIQAQKDALSAEKDYHDYQKTLEESTKAVTDIERQLAAMSDDDSAASIAKRKKLEEELSEAREALAEEEYAHSIEAQQNALDESQTAYEEARQAEIETLQNSLEEVDTLLTESFNAVRENATLIGEELITMAQTLNITMSPELTAPWQAGESAIASYSELFDIQSSAFMTRLGEVEQSEYAVQNQADQSSVSIALMFAQQSAELCSQIDAANRELQQAQSDADSGAEKIANLFAQQSDALIIQIQNAYREIEALQSDADNASGAIADAFGQQADSLAAQIQYAYAEMEALERDSENASRSIADAFGNRADELVSTIENARNSASNLKAMSDALANSLNNSIDGSYSGASAVSALDSIADAANGVADAARNAAQALQDLGAARQQQTTTRDVTIYRGLNGTGTDLGSVTARVDSNGRVTNRNSIFTGHASGIKRVTHDELAWTQENGPEMIVSPSDGSILTPLSRGDSVLPADMTSNIWEWARFDPTEFVKKLMQNMPSAGANMQANTMQVGSLVTVNGNVNDSVEMMKIAATTASTKIKQSFNELSNGLNR